MNPTGYESEQVAVIDHYARHGDQYERRTRIGNSSAQLKVSLTQFLQINADFYRRIPEKFRIPSPTHAKRQDFAPSTPKTARTPNQPHKRPQGEVKNPRHQATR